MADEKDRVPSANQKSLQVTIIQSEVPFPYLGQLLLVPLLLLPLLDLVEVLVHRPLVLGVVQTEDIRQVVEVYVGSVGLGVQWDVVTEYHLVPARYIT